MSRRNKNLRFFKEIDNLEELRETVGNVTISFAVDPEIKYLLTLGAKKAGVSFSEFCRQLIEKKAEDLATWKMLDFSQEIKGKEKKEKKDLHFWSRGDLTRHLKSEGFNLETCGVIKDEKEIRVRLKSYLIKRLSHTEYSLTEL